MIYLPESLKTMLAALAVQNVGDYLSDEEKKANLERVLANIEKEHLPEPATDPHSTNHTDPSSPRFQA